MNIKSTIAQSTAFFLEKVLSGIGQNFFQEVISTLALGSVGSSRQRSFRVMSTDMILFDKADTELIQRIILSYQRAKIAQQDAPQVYAPSSLWQKQLDEAYSSLYSSKIEDVGYFLQNFGVWPIYTGIESAMLIRELSGSTLSRRKLYGMFNALLTFWEKHERKGRDLSCLSYPRHGNQSGVMLDETFMGVGSVFSDVHSSVLSNLIKNTNRPIIGEIGAGYGKLISFVSKKINDFCYMDFDLPETLCCAAYFLIKTFPEKKFMLFGEDEFSIESLKSYDFILLPSFCIEKMPEFSVDLWMNQNSLGEMAPETTKHFIEQIERTGRAWFWHMNHEFIRNYFNENSSSLLNQEYFSSDNVFKIISRYMDTGHGIYQGGFDYMSDTYCYVYQHASHLTGEVRT